jgi:cell division protein FtsB
VPNASGVNRRKRHEKKKEPRFLRKAFPGYGRGTSTNVLRVLAWTVGLWFAYAILFGDSGLVSIIQLHGMEDELQSEITELQAERDETEALRDDLKNDPWTLEKVAREEYGMIKEGETCYRVEPGLEPETGE